MLLHAALSPSYSHPVNLSRIAITYYTWVKSEFSNRVRSLLDFYNCARPPEIRCYKYVVISHVGRFLCLLCVEYFCTNWCGVPGSEWKFYDEGKISDSSTCATVQPFKIKVPPSSLLASFPPCLLTLKRYTRAITEIIFCLLQAEIILFRGSISLSIWL